MAQMYILDVLLVAWMHLEEYMRVTNSLVLETSAVLALYCRFH
jgi:hypothetical protein